MGTDILKLTLMLAIITALIHANTAAPADASFWPQPQKKGLDSYLRAKSAHQNLHNLRFYGNDNNRKMKKDYYTDCNYSPLACFIKSRRSSW